MQNQIITDMAIPDYAHESWKVNVQDINFLHFTNQLIISQRQTRTIFLAVAMQTFSITD